MCDVCTDVCAVDCVMLCVSVRVCVCTRVRESMFVCVCVWCVGVWGCGVVHVLCMTYGWIGVYHVLRVWE